MKLVCLVKFIPDIKQFKYDTVKNTIIRENVRQIINPADSLALASALEFKNKFPNISIEIVTMGPKSVLPQFKDLLRLGVDSGVLLSDHDFIGSDTYITSKIIAKFLTTTNYDLLLGGTHSLDGDTAHVLAQIAAYLNLNFLTGVTKIESVKPLEVIVESEKKLTKFQLKMPCVLGVMSTAKYKLPYVKFADLNLDVDERIRIVSSEELGFLPKDIGLLGSPTKVIKLQAIKQVEKIQQKVSLDDDGIEAVYQFLLEKGFIKRDL